MSETIHGPRVVMDWLSGTAKVAAKAGLPITWTAPSGFVVQQAYTDVSGSRVATKIGDEIIRVSLARDSNILDRNKQTRAIAPNFVHSLDASALMLTINQARANGITQFAAVHDSYGTLAADMPMLQVCLRESFVQMYQDHDVLEELRTSVAAIVPNATLPDVPEKGTLDLTEILRSDFFFA